MYAILPLLSWLGLFLIIYAGGNGWRTSFLTASILWGVLLVFITELLNLRGLITFPWVLGSWGLVVATLAVIYSRIKRRIPSRNQLLRPTPFEPWSVFLLCGVISIVLITGLVAWLAPPNTDDAMSYHMSRVAHWQQNHSIAHYPTNILRQLVFPPWAEWAILHFQILSGGDRFANFVQWFAVAGSLIGVSLIASELGADRRGQILAVLVCATLPMLVLQGSSTQNDATAALWLISLVYFVLLMRTRMNRFYPYLAGMSLGLALLTKSTAYLLGLPFLLWFVVQRARADRLLAWKPLCIVAVAALALNLGFYQRNTNSFGHPLNPGHIDMFNVINETISLPTFVSNAVRNIALHGVLPSHRLRGVVWGLEKAVRGLHRRLGMDVNDPKTTQEGTAFQLTTLRALHEDTAGNPLHLMLIGLCTIMFLGLCLQKQWRLLTSYFICVLMGFLLIILYLKWSPWHSRFHLASFMLWSAFVGLMLSTGLNRTMANIAAVLLLVAAVPWVLFNNTRPLLRLGDGSRSIIRSNRVSDYFRNSSEREAPFRGAAEIVQTQRCSQIGLDTGNNEDEYQLWVLLKKSTGDRVRIEHVNTPAYARALAAHFNEFRPCAIISVHSGDSGESTRISSGSDVYRRVWWAYPVGVFVRGES